ncbi:hypothetical protein RAM19_05660 [Bartonella apihabitans]|nr:hypothetical protein [Bartonella apihabitans]WLT09616.1 hypothetical protein RAM19_05660 [Bartonella apihabitans]
MIDRFETAICGVCGRSAVGFGYCSNPGHHGSKILWVCDDPECLKIARDTYEMKQDDFSRLESLASGKGLDAGGAFLDEIKKTDLADLTKDEWFEFGRRIIAGYRRALKEDLKDYVPF